MFFNPRRMNKVVMRETEHRNKEKKKTSEHVFQWLQGPSLTPGTECRPKFRSSQRLPKKNMSKQRKMPQNQHEASVQSVETNRQFLEVTPLKLQSDFNQWLMDLWGKKKKKAINTSGNGFPENKLNPGNVISCFPKVTRLNKLRKSQETVNLIGQCLSSQPIQDGGWWSKEGPMQTPTGWWWGRVEAVHVAQAMLCLPWGGLSVKRRGAMKWHTGIETVGDGDRLW